MAWFCAGVQKNAHFRVEDTAESCKKPTMRVDLFAVLLLEAEDHLYRRKGARTVINRPYQLLTSCDRQLSGIFKLERS